MFTRSRLVGEISLTIPMANTIGNCLFFTRDDAATPFTFGKGVYPGGHLSSSFLRRPSKSVLPTINILGTLSSLQLFFPSKIVLPWTNSSRPFLRQTVYS